jgi:hypothetical protein
MAELQPHCGTVFPATYHLARFQTRKVQPVNQPRRLYENYFGSGKIFVILYLIPTLKLNTLYGWDLKQVYLVAGLQVKL